MTHKGAHTSYLVTAVIVSTAADGYELIDARLCANARAINSALANTYASNVLRASPPDCLNAVIDHFPGGAPGGRA